MANQEYCVKCGNSGWAVVLVEANGENVCSECIENEEGHESVLVTPQCEAFYLDFPPFSGDLVTFLSAEEFFAGEQPAKHNFERVEVGANQEYASIEALEAWVSHRNEEDGRR